MDCSLMSQFHPCSNVPDEINRGILKEEYALKTIYFLILIGIITFWDEK